LLTGESRLFAAATGFFLSRNRGFPVSQPGAQFGGGLAVAEQAECADVVQIALAASFGDREDVVGVPQAAPTCDALHTVKPKTGGSRGTPGAFECSIGGYGIDLADSASAAIASKDLVAKISGIGAKTPLVYAVVAAEGSPTLCEDLKITPTAERKAIGAHGQVVATRTAAGECARG
jgi:hypothetical protein